jgi:hypothetical protein
VHDPENMNGIVLIAAAFASTEIAGVALDRLRRYQAGREGRLRMARLGAVGRVADDAVVAGPVFEDDVEVVRRTVEDLGGRLAVIVRKPLS